MLHRFKQEFRLKNLGINFCNSMSMPEINGMEEISHVQVTFPSTVSLAPLQRLSHNKTLLLHSLCLKNNANKEVVKGYWKAFSKHQCKVSLIEHFMFFDDPETYRNPFTFQLRLQEHNEILKEIKEFTGSLYLENLPVTQNVDLYYSSLHSLKCQEGFEVLLDLNHLIISAVASKKSKRWIKMWIKKLDPKIMHISGLNTARNKVVDNHDSLNLSFLNSFREEVSGKVCTIENSSKYSLDMMSKALIWNRKFHYEDISATEDFMNVLHQLKREADIFFKSDSTNNTSTTSGIFTQIKNTYPFGTPFGSLEKVNDLQGLTINIAKRAKLIHNHYSNAHKAALFTFQISSKEKVVKVYGEPGTNLIGTYKTNINDNYSIHLNAYL